MSTLPAKAMLALALDGVDNKFQGRIIDAYVLLRAAYDEGGFDSAALRVGKFAESVLRFLQHELTGNYVPFGTKINNFSEACKNLEQLPGTAGSENLRVVMPRALNFAYTLRNKRGIGHVGGDVDANQIDAATMVRIADWCLCEMMRIYHSMDLQEAQALLDAISVRQLPCVWSVLGRKRVLDTTLDYKSKVLVLLHSELTAGVPCEDLLQWTEYTRPSEFMVRILRPLHREKLIELDPDTDVAIISPLGARKVEEQILPNLKN